MIISDQNAIKNGSSYIIVNFEHFNGKWMNFKIMNSKKNKLWSENACSQKKGILEKKT